MVAEFQQGGENVERYVGNPYVKGDHVAEHSARITRLAVYCMPFLLIEFANHPDREHLAEDIYVTVLTHDDDEIVDGFDIRTSIKEHNAKDGQEVINLSKKLSILDEVQQKYVLEKFSSFRNKNTLAAKIAKAFDNISGNQLVVEQKIGMVAPDSAKFAIQYLEKVRGTSQTTDMLIDAQINKILAYRKMASSDEKELIFLVDRAGEQEGSSLSKNDLRDLIKKLLEIDVSAYQLNKEQIDTPIYGYLNK